jgi:hypothetical protein
MGTNMSVVFPRFSGMCTLAVILVSAFVGCKGDKKATPQSAEASRPVTPAAPVATPSTAGSPQQNMSNGWTVAEEFDFDWERNGIPAHFKIEQNMAEQMCRLTIGIKGQPDFVVQDDETIWVELSKGFEKQFLSKNTNLAPSVYVYSLAPSQSADHKPLLLLTTWAYASDPGKLYVLGLDSSGHPKVLLSTLFDITEFHDLDGDGTAEIAGRPCFSQSSGNDVFSYDPFHVYQLQSSPEMELKLSLPLSQEYNLKNYYGWAGPDCSEKLAVVLHPPAGGKPVIVTSDEARKMFENKK